MTDLPPPDWYPVGTSLRYWDGERWTEHTRPADAGAGPAGAGPADAGGPPAPEPAFDELWLDPVPQPEASATRPVQLRVHRWLGASIEALTGHSRLGRRVRSGHAAGEEGPDGEAGPVGRRLAPDRMATLVLVGLIGVLGLTAGGLMVVRRADAGNAVRSACTRAIASTGASVRASSLRSVQGSGGKWSVGVQATDGSGTQEWVCHVVWDGSRATVLTAVPGAG